MEVNTFGNTLVRFRWQGGLRTASFSPTSFATTPERGQLVIIARCGANQSWAVEELLPARQRVRGVIWKIETFPSGCTLWFSIFFSEGDQAFLPMNTVTLSSVQLSNWRAVETGQRREPIRGDAVYPPGIMRYDRNKTHWKTDDWLQSPSGEATGKRDRSRSRSSSPLKKRQV